MIFWIFPSGEHRACDGTLPVPNAFAAFIEVVPPLALYRSLRHSGQALLYSCLAGVMYAWVIAFASRAGTVGHRRVCAPNGMDAWIVIVIALVAAATNKRAALHE